MFATYRAKVERIILFVKIVNRYFERKECFSAASEEEVLMAVLCSCRRIKVRKLGEFFVHVTVTKCLHLASENFVLASELNLSLATGLAS